MKIFYWDRRELSKGRNLTILRYSYCHKYRTLQCLLVIMALTLVLNSKSVLAQYSKTDIVPEHVIADNTIGVGQKVPVEFWDQKHTIYEDGKTRVITLKEFKGKVLVLDFWSVSCGNCIFHQKAISYFKEKYPEDLEVIMVNPLRTKDNIDRITAFEERFGQEYFPNGFRSIILDNELTNLFGVRAFPTYVWITPGGMVQTITFWNFLNKDAEMRFHRGKGL